jgi:hypothetical protein
LIALFVTSGLVLLSMSAVLIIFQAQIGSPVMKYTHALQSRMENDVEFALVPAGTQELRTLANAFNKQWHANQRQLSYNLRLENEKLRQDSLLRMDEMHDASIGELMDCALAAGLALTRSALGYIFLYDEATQRLTRCSRSGIALDKCSTIAGETTHRLEETGWLGEAIRQRRSLIVNNPVAGPHKKSFAEEEIVPTRHISVPVFSEGQIVLLIGVGNKDADYDQADVQHLSHLMDDAWKIIARRNAEARAGLPVSLRRIFARTGMAPSTRSLPAAIAAETRTLASLSRRPPVTRTPASASVPT